MPRVGFEPNIQVFERAKTIYALDGAATVVGILNISLKKTCARPPKILHYEHTAPPLSTLQTVKFNSNTLSSATNVHCKSFRLSDRY
jgi:hypothetical protein